MDELRFVDPFCHTLVGASLGVTGLEKKTRYGCATLVLAANLPDIDAAAYLVGSPAAYAFRRGVTHGIPAMIILPVVLGLGVTLWGRVRGGAGRDDVSPFWLIVLSAVGVATHPALDWLNTYGMRWLMPIADVWFYGDTLFIIDWPIWLILLLGLVASRVVDRERLRWFQRPACTALAVALTYIAASFGITHLAERAVLERLERNPPQRLMASPVPLDPLRRAIVLDYGTVYRFATVRFGLRSRIDWDAAAIAKGDPTAFELAERTRAGRWFLHWARFPFAEAEPSEDGTTVRLADARYVRSFDDGARRGFATLVLESPEYPAER